MKIVLDTNVLISGLLKSNSDAGAIVRMLAGGFLQVVYDARIITEYREVLSRPKFALEDTEIETILSIIEAEGLLVVGRPLQERLPDPDDEPFLEVALAGDAVLITGNGKHYRPTASREVMVLSPAEFISLYRKTAETE